MDKEQLLIQVFHGADGNCAACSGGCQAQGQGVRAATEQVATELDARYGSRVRIEYIDIFAVNLNHYPRVIGAIKDNYDMPIITFNEHPRLSGAINLEDIMEVITEMAL